MSAIRCHLDELIWFNAEIGKKCVPYFIRKNIAVISLYNGDEGRRALGYKTTDSPILPSDWVMFQSLSLAMKSPYVMQDKAPCPVLAELQTHFLLILS